MSELPPIWVPEIPHIPSTIDQIQDATNKITKALTDSQVHFDQDLSFAIAVIADRLCLVGVLQRDELVESFRAIHEQRKLKWTGGYSPLSFLADALEGAGKLPESTDGKSGMTQLFEVIEGGLSKKPEPEPVE
jgi:hypothetical protein